MPPLSSFLFVLRVYMWFVHVCACVCTGWVPMHVHGGQRRRLAVFLYTFLQYPLETGSLTTPRACFVSVIPC